MFSQVYEYYNQALQFLDSQGPSYMGSRKAKVRNDHRQAICDEPQISASCLCLVHLNTSQLLWDNSLNSSESKCTHLLYKICSLHILLATECARVCYQYTHLIVYLVNPISCIKCITDVYMVPWAVCLPFSVPNDCGLRFLWPTGTIKHFSQGLFLVSHTSASHMKPTKATKKHFSRTVFCSTHP